LSRLRNPLSVEEVARLSSMAFVQVSALKVVELVKL
jgi:hypothetical protein